MEQSRTNNQSALEAYSLAQNAYDNELGQLHKTGRECRQRADELEEAIKHTVEFEPAGPEPSLSYFVWSPLKAIFSAVVTGFIFYYVGGWLLFSKIKAYTKLADKIMLDAALILMAVAAAVAVVGYLMYRSRHQQWELDNDTYESSKYKRTSEELKHCKDTIEATTLEIASLLHRRSEELLAFSDPELEQVLASGNRLFQKEIKLSADLDEWIEKRIDTFGKNAEEIVIDKDREEPDYSYEAAPGVLLLLALVALLVVHCLVWMLKLVFDISWNTWGWMCSTLIWGVPIVMAVMVIAGLLRCAKAWNWHIFSEDKATKKALKESLKKKKTKYTELTDGMWNPDGMALLERRNTVMRSLLNKNLALPIRDLGEWNFHEAFNTYFEMLNEHKFIGTLQGAERTSAVISFYDKKLDLFYRHSIKSEAGENAELYKDYEWALKSKSAGELRHSFTPDAATMKHLNRLTDKNDNFIDLDGVLNDFVELLDMDTSGTFLEYDSKKVEKKTKAMQQSYNDFAKTVNGFGKLVAQINRSLGAARMVAYRNIYLGAELVNIVHQTGSGGTLTRADDSMNSIEAVSIQVSGIESAGMKQTALDILDTSIGAVAVAVNNVLNDKAAKKYYKRNPKEAIATAAGVAVVSAINGAIEAWEKRNEMIAKSLKVQEELVDKMDELAESYLDSQAKATRALELIRAIVKVNNGFMSVYEPLREKVFDDKAPSAVTMQELQQLVLAIKDYKSISDSKL